MLMLVLDRLLKHFTIVAITIGALTLSIGSISAADLTGSCCGDLEERIAELEATTASKGNRKMSLTISGQIHRVVLWWDDGEYGGEIIGAPSGYAGETTVHKKDALWRLIQTGISKNWFGYGATSLYSEYGIVNNTGADITNATGAIMGRDYTVAANT